GRRLVGEAGDAADRHRISIRGEADEAVRATRGGVRGGDSPAGGGLDADLNAGERQVPRVQKAAAVDVIRDRAAQIQREDGRRRAETEGHRDTQNQREKQRWASGAVPAPALPVRNHCCLLSHYEAGFRSGRPAYLAIPRSLAMKRWAGHYSTAVY